MGSMVAAQSNSDSSVVAKVECKGVSVSMNALINASSVVATVECKVVEHILLYPPCPLQLLLQ